MAPTAREARQDEDKKRNRRKQRNYKMVAAQTHATNTRMPGGHPSTGSGTWPPQIAATLAVQNRLSCRWASISLSHQLRRAV